MSYNKANFDLTKIGTINTGKIACKHCTETQNLTGETIYAGDLRGTVTCDHCGSDLKATAQVAQVAQPANSTPISYIRMMTAILAEIARYDSRFDRPVTIVTATSKRNWLAALLDAMPDQAPVFTYDRPVPGPLGRILNAPVPTL